MASIDTTAPRPDLNVAWWRLGDLSGKVDGLIRWRGEVDQDRVRYDSLEDAVKELHKELAGVKTALIRMSLTLASSAVVFALSILAATGRLP